MFIELPCDEVIEVILPVYTEEGDCTQLYLQDGTTIIYPVNIATILRRLANRNFTRLNLLRSKAIHYLGSVQSPPLQFSSHLLLMPIKTRQPKISTDSSLGYVNYFAIKAAMMEKKHTQVKTQGNHTINILWNYKTYQEHFCKALCLYKATQETECLVSFLQGLLKPQQALQPI